MSNTDVALEKRLEVSIVLPCLNEETTVGICVTKAIKFLRTNEIRGEVIIATMAA